MIIFKCLDFYLDAYMPILCLDKTVPIWKIYEVRYFLTKCSGQNTGLCESSTLQTYKTLLHATFHFSKTKIHLNGKRMWGTLKEIKSKSSISKKEFHRYFDQWKTRWNKMCWMPNYLRHSTQCVIHCSCLFCFAQSAGAVEYTDCTSAGG